MTFCSNFNAEDLKFPLAIKKKQCLVLALRCDRGTSTKNIKKATKNAVVKHPSTWFPRSLADFFHFLIYCFSMMMLLVVNWIEILLLFMWFMWLLLDGSDRSLWNGFYDIQIHFSFLTLLMYETFIEWSASLSLKWMWCVGGFVKSRERFVSDDTKMRKDSSDSN